jgi:hypothetical protein
VVVASQVVPAAVRRRRSSRLILSAAIILVFHSHSKAQDPPTDVVVQQAKLTAPAPTKGWHPFGWSVAASGDTLVVGAPDWNSPPGLGSAFVYAKPTAGWTDITPTARLTAGVMWLDPGGRAYAFVKPVAGWPASMTETGAFSAADGYPGDGFAVSATAVAGDAILAGAPFANVNGVFNYGAAYLFRVRGPRITRFSTPHAPASSLITIRGLGFRGPVALAFDGVAAEIEVINETTLQAVVPQLPPGPVEVTLTTEEGTFTVPKDAAVFAIGRGTRPRPSERGPRPATSDGRSTSVGTRAILRSPRQVCYQGFPDSTLPDELKEGNPLGILRLVDGHLVDGQWTRE